MGRTFGIRWAVDWFVFAAIALSAIPDLLLAQRIGPAQLVVLDARAHKFIEELPSMSRADLLDHFPEHGDVTYTLTVHRNGRSTQGTWRLPAKDVGAALLEPLFSSFFFNPEGQKIGRLIHQVVIREAPWYRVFETRYVPLGEGATSPIYLEWRLEHGRWVISAVGDENLDVSHLPRWCC
jgi:hypothetical protein